MQAKPRPGAITWIWVTGIVLAVLAYVIGPDRFMDTVWAVLWDLQTALTRLAENLELVSFDLLRAAAIGLFIVFVLLCLIAIRRRLRGWMALILVSFFYLSAVGSGSYQDSRGGWFMAFLLALGGAMGMTTRLMRAERVPTRP